MQYYPALSIVDDEDILLPDMGAVGRKIPNITTDAF